MPPVTPSIDTLTHAEAETTALGTRLARDLRRGSVIHLFGDLGAGKTAFVRGLAIGLGLDPDEVSSPTFTLIQEYRHSAASADSSAQTDAPLTLFHVDLYRLAGPEVTDLDLDAIGAEGIMAIEWADRLPAADARAIIVRIEDAGGDDRRVRVEWPASA
jgi:tRNA threonylcarbamoyladenosine biosynthesis protein TsaE